MYNVADRKGGGGAERATPRRARSRVDSSRCSSGTQRATVTLSYARPRCLCWWLSCVRVLQLGLIRKLRHAWRGPFSTKFGRHTLTSDICRMENPVFGTSPKAHNFFRVFFWYQMCAVFDSLLVWAGVTLDFAAFRLALRLIFLRFTPPGTPLVTRA